MKPERLQLIREFYGPKTIGDTTYIHSPVIVELLTALEQSQSHLAAFVELAGGVTGADASDAIGSIKVHYSDGSTMYLADAFERAVAEVRKP